MLICSNGWTQLVIDRGFQNAGFCILKFTMSNNKRVSILMQVEPLSLLHFVPNYITNCGDLPRKSLQTLKKHQKLGKNDDEISCPTHWFLVSKNPILQTRSITKSNPMHQVWLFRPPFINGRPQDLVSVFWRKKKPLPPFFESKCPFFIYIIFHFFHSHHL